VCVFFVESSLLGKVLEYYLNLSGIFSITKDTLAVWLGFFFSPRGLDFLALLFQQIIIYKQFNLEFPLDIS